ncbi:MAG: alginate export family protein [bacterium]
MKKALLSFGAIMIIALPVLAKMPKIDVKGEIRVRAEEINNAADFKNTDAAGNNDDKDSHVKHRVRVWLGSELSDGIGAHICLCKPDTGREWAKQGAGDLNKLQDNIAFRHAYLTIDDVADLVDLALGRQEIGTKDRELVLWEDAIDAKKASVELRDLSLSAICAKANENGAANDTDTNIQGLTGSIALDLLGGIDLAGYGYRKTIHKPVKDNTDKNNVIGGKVSGSLDIASTLNYSAEYAKQVGGTPTDRDANAYRVCLGYTTEVEGLGKLSIEGSYLKMSGTEGATADAKSYSGIDPDLDYYAVLVDDQRAVIFTPAGGVDLTKVNGRKDLNINAQITPEAIDNITLGISYTSFSTAEKVKATGNKTSLGSELDLSCSYRYSDTTKITGTYARFSPGDIWATGNRDTASMLRCELLTKF